MDKRKVTQIDYTNWRGERRVREILPTGHLEFSNTKYHPESQWLLEAVDVEDGKIKLFAMKDIHSFGVTEPASPWRDIESAPRDGTSIEVWDESPGAVNPAVVFWENGVWVYADNLLADAAPDGALPSHWRQRSEPPR